MNSTARHFVAEFVGIFALVFIGSGSIVAAARFGPASPGTLLSIALAHGLILALMVSSTMNVSGGHLNPAVTVAMLLTGRIPAPMAGVHIVAQLLGAVCGSLALKGLMPPEVFVAVKGGGQGIALDVTLTQAIALEAVATFFLVFVIFGTAVNPDAPKIGGLAIGLTIAADILVLGPLTGASMNPARSFGPAFVSSAWEGQIAYWIGPLIGAIVAAFLWDKVLLTRVTRDAPTPAKPRSS
jgi:MIP family channel proteins